MAYLTLQSMIDMLQELKQNYPPETPIVMMSDSEGNDWSRATDSYGGGYIDNEDDLITEDEFYDLTLQDPRITTDDFEQVILLWRS